MKELVQVIQKTGNLKIGCSHKQGTSLKFKGIRIRDASFSRFARFMAVKEVKLELKFIEEKQPPHVFIRLALILAKAEVE